MLDTGKDADWFSSPAIVVELIIAIVGFIAWLIWELNEENPIVDLSLFRSRNFALGTLVFCLAYALFFGANLLQPLWLQTQMGYIATWAGLVARPQRRGRGVPDPVRRPADEPGRRALDRQPVAARLRRLVLHALGLHPRRRLRRPGLADAGAGHRHEHLLRLDDHHVPERRRRAAGAVGLRPLQLRRGSPPAASPPRWSPPSGIAARPCTRPAWPRPWAAPTPPG